MKRTRNPTNSLSSASLDSRIHSKTDIYSAVVSQQQLAKKYSIGGFNTRRPRRQNSTQKPTLAQKLGMEPVPEPIDWSALKALASSRGHLSSACPICMDRYGDANRKVCLLSCSHVFHLSCITNFERFLRKQHVRSETGDMIAETPKCPCCRASDYSKLNVTSFAHQHMRSWAALQIQRIWRGYLRGKEYTKRRWEKYPHERTQYLSNKITTLSTRLQAHTNRRTHDIEEFLRNLDRSVAQSRLVMMGEGDWQDIEQDARKKITSDHDCAICMCPVKLGRGEKKVAMTSCGHVFHEACLGGWEGYLEGKECVCPMCRAPFLRKVLE